MQERIFGKMLRRGRLSLFQFCIENAALTFLHLRQSSELPFAVQNIGQNLALHRFPAFFQNLLALGGKFLPGTFGGQHGFQIPERFADCHQGSGDNQLQNVPFALGQSI